MADRDDFTDEETDAQDKGPLWHRGVGVLAVSWVMALAILAGWFAGWLLDRNVTGTFPLMTILGVLAGIIGGGWYSYRTIMRGLRR
ncbi:MAG: AtpZ/AtpI family protein [Phycisphaerae bacterium]